MRTVTHFVIVFQHLVQGCDMGNERDCFPPEIPESFSATLAIKTESKALKEIKDDHIVMNVEYRTNGKDWKVMYYNGLQTEGTNEHGVYRELYEGGQKNCHTAKSQDMFRWNKMNIFPRNIRDYTFDGFATIRNVRCQRWIAPADQPESDKGYWFFVDAVTKTPMLWAVIRNRNPVIDSHRDLWTFHYYSFSEYIPDRSDFSAPPACDFTIATLAADAKPNLRFFLGMQTEFLGRLPYKTEMPTPADWIPHEHSALPRDFDWGHLGGYVKDQGTCGSCWAFSHTQGVASKWAVEQHRKGNFDVQVPILSEQQIVDCAFTSHSFGCDGGNYDDPDEEGMPLTLSLDYGGYLSINGKCHNAPTFVRLSHWIQVTHMGQNLETRIENCKLALYLHGPLSVNVRVAENFVAYTNGVYNEEYCTDGLISDMDTNHAVMVVGFGHDEDFDYWRIKNSWSVVWGENGYIRINTQKDCGVTTHPGYPILHPATPEDEMYQVARMQEQRKQLDREHIDHRADSLKEDASNSVPETEYVS